MAIEDIAWLHRYMGSGPVDSSYGDVLLTRIRRYRNARFDPLYSAYMLTHLAIQNFATVDRLEIEFESGMSAITGETGAGKSIILGALGFTLGDRADKTIVRPGASRAEISAEFDTSRVVDAQAWLQDHDLVSQDSPELCILRRVVNNDGRSRAYINGSPVNMSSLKALGEMLIDIHSQHEHQSLLQRSTHQRLLDEFGVDARLLANLTSTWKQWRQNDQHLQQLSQQAEENSAQTQLLSYQLTELEELDIAEDEFSSLEAEFKALNQADDILSGTRSALGQLGEDEENLSNQLGGLLNRLRDMRDRHEAIGSIVTLLENAEIQIEEAVSELRLFNDGFDADPERLEQVNARLGVLHNVARKHKITPAELPQLVADLRAQLNRFENCDAELEQLTANDEMLRDQYQQLATELSKQRKKAGSKLVKQINEQLQVLGMPHASLAVELSELDPGSPNRNGLESVEFLVSTNPGQPAKPLIKIASGGELSRISLAIQVITAQTSAIPSLVFDEVDVGIGGAVARVVGELLRKLGESNQVLCVTHQAQVAGQGHHHFQVAKVAKGKNTTTSIRALDDEEIVKEVARMLGGEQGAEEFSDESLAHAQQMVANLS